MTTRAYLEQILKFDSKIRNKLIEVERLRELAQSTSTSVKDIDVQTSNVGHKMENIVVEIVALEDEIAEMQKRRKYIIGQIEGIEDKNLCEMLIQRYVQEKLYKEVELSRPYSVSYKKALMSKARVTFEKQYGAEYL